MTVLRCVAIVFAICCALVTPVMVIGALITVALAEALPLEDGLLIGVAVGVVGRL